MECGMEVCEHIHVDCSVLLTFNPWHSLFSVSVWIEVIFLRHLDRPDTEDTSAHNSKHSETHRETTSESQL